MLSAGETLDRYTVEGALGEGGMATVYLAYDPRLRRHVALKLVHAEGAASESARARLVREALAVASLTHPNIVAVYDVGETAMGPFIAMELVRGKTLRSYVGDASVPAAKKVRWLADVARALAAAHARGIVHRDVKPGNVMVSEDGTVKVLDFGVARWMAAAPTSARQEPAPLPSSRRGALSAVTAEGTVVGTPRYMAPEQLRGEAVDGRTDQFAWGLVAYELLTGRHAWSAIDDPVSMWGEMMLHPPKAIGDALPPQLAAAEIVILRALQPLRDARFPTVDDLLHALEGSGEPRTSDGVVLVSREASTPPPMVDAPTVAEGPRRPPARWRLIAGGGAATLALAAAGIGVAFLGGSGGRPAPPKASRPAVKIAPSPPPSPTFRTEGAHRVTFGGGCDELPSFSADGAAVVYERSAGTGVAIDILHASDGWTQVVPFIGADPDIMNLAPRFSPQGDRVAFLRVSAGAVGSFVGRVDGGEAPRSIAVGPTRPSWSPDGHGIWAGGLGTLDEYDADTGEKLRSVRLPTDAIPTHTLALSDGRLVAIFDPSAHSHVTGLALLSEREDAVWLLRGEIEEVLALTPDEKSAITARVTAMNTEELVAVPLDGSPVQSLAGSGIPVGKGLDLSRDGRRVTWSTCRSTPMIMEVTASGFGRSIADDESDSMALAAIPGSSRIAILSQRSGTQQPWIADIDGRAPARMLPIAPVDPIEIAVSGDGARFAVATLDQGIYVGNVDGDVAVRRLTDHAGDTSPTFRFGDREILFTRLAPDGKSRVMRVSTEGGEPAPLLDPGSSAPSASPVDDRVIYLQADEHQARSLELWDGRTGKRRALAPGFTARHFRAPRFSPDGRRVMAIVANHEIVEIEVASGRVLRDTTTGGDTVYSPAYTSAGIFAIRVSWAGNIWLADAEGTPGMPAH